jgi:hypothetical protein
MCPHVPLRYCSRERCFSMDHWPRISTKAAGNTTRATEIPRLNTLQLRGTRSQTIHGARWYHHMCLHVPRRQESRKRCISIDYWSGYRRGQLVTPYVPRRYRHRAAYISGVGTLVWYTKGDGATTCTIEIRGLRTQSLNETSIPTICESRW